MKTRKKMKKTEESLHDLWNTMERPKSGQLEFYKEKREKVSEKFKKIMAENFPNLEGDWTSCS